MSAEQIKRTAVATALIHLSDRTMTPEARRLWALRRLEAAASRIEREGRA